MSNALERILAHKPPLRLLFEASCAAKQASRAKHVKFLVAANTAMASFGVHLIANLYHHTRGAAGDDNFALRLPVSFDDKTWGAMVNDYVCYMEGKDPERLKQTLIREFGLDMGDFEAPDTQLQLSADPNEQHGAGYYGFLKDLPGWKMIQATLEKTDISADLVFDHDGSGQPMILLGFYSEDGRALSTHTYNLAREQGLLEDRSLGIQP